MKDGRKAKPSMSYKANPDKPTQHNTTKRFKTKAKQALSKQDAAILRTMVGCSYSSDNGGLQLFFGQWWAAAILLTMVGCSCSSDNGGLQLFIGQ